MTKSGRKTKTAVKTSAFDFDAYLKDRAKLVEKNPQCYQCVKADEVSKTYSMPKRFISLRSKEKTVTLTAEQKERAKQRLPRTDK